MKSNFVKLLGGEELNSEQKKLRKSILALTAKVHFDSNRSDLTFSACLDKPKNKYLQPCEFLPTTTDSTFLDHLMIYNPKQSSDLCGELKPWRVQR
jgi:hypothetical protein